MYSFLHNDWNEILSNEVKKDYFLKMCSFLKEEYSKKTIYPEKKNVFTALNLTSYAETKVLILGQDPYHGPNQAHGLSFSVNPTIPIPPSLKNIYKELSIDVNCTIPNNGYLKKWASQGVLLLNSVLTVESGKANSHKNIGWEIFTDYIISELNKKSTPLVFIFWGNYAIKKQKLITNQNHLVLTSVHPSPLSASRGFFGNKHFSKTNNFLIDNGLSPINWQIDSI